MDQYSYEYRGRVCLKNEGGLLVARGQIALVNLGVQCDYQMGILKDPHTPQLGYLVWVGNNPANCAAWVHLQIDWRGGSHCISFPTVGHSYTSEASNILRKKCSSEEMASEMHEVVLQIDEWFWGKPLREACEVLQVSKIVKHRGSFPEKLQGLEIEVVDPGTQIWRE